MLIIVIACALIRVGQCHNFRSDQTPSNASAYAVTCKDNPCGTDSSTTECINTEEGFNCICKDGSKPDEGQTVDFNKKACVAETCADNPCGPDYKTTICENDDVENYICRCKEGFKPQEGQNFMTNKKECIAIKCRENPCGVGNSVCEDITDGTYNCKCNDGYKLEKGQKEGANLKSCLAMTCKDYPCGFDQAKTKCEDTDGGYICKCQVGFKPVEGQSEVSNLKPCIALTCEDNPCRSSFHSSITQCINTEEGFNCLCNVGFKPDEGQTVDFNKKACVAMTCKDYPCGYNQAQTKCKDTDGGYVCKCQVGFKPVAGLSVESNLQPCIARKCDEKPCGSDHKTTVCEDVRGGAYICKCREGYKPVDGQEVESNKRACVARKCDDKPCGYDHKTTVCEDVMGGTYICKCNEGYIPAEGQDVESNKKACVEDRCVPNPCQNGAECVSTPYGSIQCECLTGTSGGMCEVVNDCASARLSCTDESNATCGFNVEKREAACKCQDPKLEYDEYAGICGAPCPLKCEHGSCRKDPEGIPRCYCSADYTGPLCQYKDACGSRRYELCNNRGECVTTGNNKFKCNCYYGYSGPRCTTGTTPVEPSPTPRFSTRRPVYQSTTPYPWYFTTNGYFRSTRDYRTTRSNEYSVSYPWYYTTNGYIRSTRDYRTTRFNENSDATRNRVWTDFTTSTDFTPVLVDHCTYDKDCLNGGMCRFEDRRGNVCLCRKPYIGDNCELNDVCESLKPTCEAIGAVCTYIKWLGKGICECPPNKTHNMELHMCEDICHPEMCALGKCEVVNSRPICRCFPGYEGHKCDRKIPKDNLRYIVLFAGILVAVVFAFVVTSTIVAIFLKRLRKVEKTELK